MREREREREREKEKNKKQVREIQRDRRHARVVVHTMRYPQGSQRRSCMGEAYVLKKLTLRALTTTSSWAHREIYALAIPPCTDMRGALTGHTDESSTSQAVHTV